MRVFRPPTVRSSRGAALRRLLRTRHARGTHGAASGATEPEQDEASGTTAPARGDVSGATASACGAASGATAPAHDGASGATAPTRGTSAQGASAQGAPGRYTPPQGASAHGASVPPRRSPYRRPPGRRRRARHRRPRAVRPAVPFRGAALPRAARAALGCLPGLVAVAALVLCATGVDRSATGPGRAAGTRATGPRPDIVPRERWAAGTTRSEAPVRYADRVAAVFVHHTDSPNDYDCADVPRIIRTLYEGQAGDRHWDDIGYNFLVDRCGTVYEGRAGGVERPVVGAHTQGFNAGTAGIAAIGTFTEGVPVPRAMTDAIAAVAAWKLGLSGVDPRAPVRLVSSNSLSRYRAGTSATFRAVAGHTDGYATVCPGAALTARLPGIRERAARLQGRT
ncbi:hypothetical protein GCM10010358_03780 [Streptomyces minutiscleroticus]|uniref:Peptidoglycan recognition protein family domain-containing protein n=1 Tax=Streptomyces minutiscleroticus TaxID=68238 RepID=A0A918K7L6_9ACTN|nr:hypothetical protein GCM10010358_03780 [Streptomyces minutiscleroticus]